MAMLLRCGRCAHYGQHSAINYNRIARGNVLQTRMVVRSSESSANGAAPSNIGRKELADAISESLGLNKRVSEEALNIILNSIVTNVAAGNKVALPGFGTWAAVQRSSRNGRNPITGAPLLIPAKTVPRFTAGSKFKEAVDPSIKTAKEAAKSKKTTTKPSAQPATKSPAASK